jgi:ABC-type phosphate/phosphonate transport system substrate-binding protein
MRRIFFALFLSIITFISVFQVFSTYSEAAKIGVLALRGREYAIKSWTPLAQYLTQQTGESFEIVPLGFEEVFSSVFLLKVDYVLVNSGFSSILIKKYGVKPLATLLNYRQGRALKDFSGVIIVRKDSPIKEIADIRGKNFMIVKKSSFGGAQMALRYFIDNRINPFKDFATITEGVTHDNVVKAVLNREVDAGTVRSDILERMEAEGKISMSKIRVLDKVNDDFPFVHSVRLYPEWPFGATKRTNDALNAKITNALFALRPEDPASKASKSAGWAPPADYTSVAECLSIVSSAP